VNLDPEGSPGHAVVPRAPRGPAMIKSDSMQTRIIPATTKLRSPILVSGGYCRIDSAREPAGKDVAVGAVMPVYRVRGGMGKARTSAAELIHPWFLFI